MIVSHLGRPRRRVSLLLCALVPVAAATAADPLADVQKSAVEWVRIRTETARLETEWHSEQALLGSIVEGLEDRAATLEESRDQAKAKTAQERSELDTLRTKNAASAADLALIARRAQEFSTTIAALQPQLPPRLAAALELPCRSLAGSGLTAGERMQLVTTVLNRCVQFDRTLTCGEEVLAMPGEPAARSYQVIYWGLSHGYALDRSAGKVWLGRPGAEHWTWEPRPDAAKAVETLIAVYQDNADPQFVAAPAQLAHPATVTLQR